MSGRPIWLTLTHRNIVDNLEFYQFASDNIPTAARARSSHTTSYIMSVNVEAAKETLSGLFKQIDTSGNSTLDVNELKAVFGDHASEFLKFCDENTDGEITLDEWLNGITSDIEGMSEADFQTNWVERMQGCITAAVPAPTTSLFCMGEAHTPLEAHPPNGSVVWCVQATLCSTSHAPWMRPSLPSMSSRSQDRPPHRLPVLDALTVYIWTGE